MAGKTGERFGWETRWKGGIDWEAGDAKNNFTVCLRYW